MEFSKIGVALFFFYLLLCGATLYGWIANIVKIVHAISDPFTTLIALRIVGVFAAPLGAILGYF